MQHILGILYLGNTLLLCFIILESENLTEKLPYLP